MDIKAKLEAILTYYAASRGVGHTRSLFSGLGFLNPTSSVRPTLVCHNEEYARILAPGNGVSLGGFEDLLKRHNKPPIQFDNAALIVLFQAALDRIVELGDTRVEIELNPEDELVLTLPRPSILEQIADEHYENWEALKLENKE